MRIQLIENIFVRHQEKQFWDIPFESQATFTLRAFMLNSDVFIRSDLVLPGCSRCSSDSSENWSRSGTAPHALKNKNKHLTCRALSPLLNMEVSKECFQAFPYKVMFCGSQRLCEQVTEDGEENHIFFLRNGCLFKSEVCVDRARSGGIVTWMSLLKPNSSRISGCQGPLQLQCEHGHSDWSKCMHKWRAQQIIRLWEILLMLERWPREFT